MMSSVSLQADTNWERKKEWLLIPPTKSLTGLLSPTSDGVAGLRVS